MANCAPKSIRRFSRSDRAAVKGEPTRPSRGARDAEAYKTLTANERTSQERELDYWTRELDALHARMQTRKARRAVDALFSAIETNLNLSAERCAAAPAPRAVVCYEWHAVYADGMTISLPS